jgi:DNA polymerase I-like protein with 3'-5' exonuclease and polymerase domains/uracil-DNA glycosylase
MSFFYNETKAEAKPKAKPTQRQRGDIPIASLQALGCSVCPRDKAEGLRSPKMPPSGTKAPYLYLLGTSPSREDDDEDMHWTDKAGAVIYEKFGKRFMEDYVRSNYTMQCMGEADLAATECCRNRIVDDIEATKPLVIVGIGDDVLRWATTLSKVSTLQHRGTLFAVKIGSHECWFYPILYPNFVFKKGGYGKSEYELILEHDVAFIRDFVLSQDFQAAKPHSGPYDDGIEIITGTEPGDMQRLELALSKIAKAINSALDIETTGLRVFMQKDPGVLTAAVGTFEHTVAFSLDHPEGWGTNAQRSRAWDLFLRFLLESGTKAAHNLAMEMEWLSFKLGDRMLRMTQWDDTMAMAHTLDERGGTKSLEVQTVIHFGFNLKAQSNVDVRQPQWWLKYKLKDILRYNGMDTKWTDLLRRTLAPKIAANPAYQGEYDRKVRTASTLVLMENLGLPVDAEYAEEMEKALSAELEIVEAKARRCPEVKTYSSRFGTFSLTNNDHVLKMMKDVLKRDEIKVIDKRSGKQTGYTTDEEALSKMPVAEVPSAPLILEHRGVSKLLSTYVVPVTSRKIVGVDGLLHSKYSSMVAVTGRLASEDPNIQNWPKRKHKKIRGMVAAPPGEWMVACDYGQIEFRVVGMASEDDNLVKYCWTGYDVHKYWAQRMVDEYGPIKDYIVETFGVDWDEKGLKTLRQESKNGWVFPQLFGSSTRSCAEQLHLPQDVADELAAEFWDEFRKVKTWQENLLRSYERKGYVETLDGRRRRGPQTKNEIINHPIQGTALSIVCAGMNALSELSEIMERPELHPRFNGHDDLSFFMADDAVEANLAIISKEMCQPRFDFINVPLIVEASVGARWNELEEIAVYRSNEMFGTANPYAGAA